MATFYEMLGLRKSRDWVRSSFLTPNRELSEQKRRFMTYSSVTTKFVDTRIGGNIGLNMPPALTKYVDLPYRSAALKSSGRDASDGMGPYYSEVYDDNSQIVHFQYGFQNPSGMVSFFTGFYNGQASYMAHTGRTPGFMYWAGRGATFLATLTPGMVILQLTAASLRFLAMEPSGKYYTIKPAMNVFWTRANTIANIMGINKKLVEPYFEIVAPNTYRSPDVTRLNNAEAQQTYRESLHKLAPDIFEENGEINVMSIATRTQRIANKHLDNLEKIQEQAGNIDAFISRVREYLDEGTYGGLDLKPGQSASDTEPGTARYFESWATDVLYTFSQTTDTDQILDDSMRARFALRDDTTQELYDTIDGQRDLNADGSRQGTVSGIWGKIEASLGKYEDLFRAHQRDGSMWLSLRVDYTGQHSTTFTNQHGEPEIKQRINDVSSRSRSARFSVMDGKIGLSLIDGVVQGIKDMARGALDQLQVSGLMALGGSALVDIQNTWQGSSIQLPTATFTIKSRPWSADPFTVFMAQDLLIAVLLAGALPLSTGPASYTSPLYVSCFSQGKFLIREGLISSLTITRATSNVSNTDDWRDLGVDISIEVADMSSIMHAPISDGFKITSPISSISNMLNNEGTFLDWMAAYSGQSLEETYYNSRRVTNAITRLASSFSDRFQAETVIGGAFDSPVTRFLVGAFAQNGVRSVQR